MNCCFVLFLFLRSSFFSRASAKRDPSEKIQVAQIKSRRREMMEHLQRKLFETDYLKKICRISASVFESSHDHMVILKLELSKCLQLCKHIQKIMWKFDEGLLSAFPFTFCFHSRNLKPCTWRAPSGKDSMMWTTLCFRRCLSVSAGCLF